MVALTAAHSQTGDVERSEFQPAGLGSRHLMVIVGKPSGPLVGSGGRSRFLCG